MNKEKYLVKIKKLLNLARKTTNQYEAAAALRKAQSLMAAHGVSEVDAESTDINEACSKGAPNHAQTPPQYLSYLVSVIKRAFGVEAIYSWHEGKYSRSSPRRIIRFYGPSSRPQIAAYAFDVLSRQMTAARKDFMSRIHGNTKPATRTAQADRFCEGWATGVYHVVAELATTESEVTLMAVYRDRHYPDLTGFSRREARECRNGDAARYSGFISGRNARLNAGVASAGEDGQKLIGGTD